MPLQADRSLFIVSTSAAPCGVEDFARKMTTALQRHEPAGANSLLEISGRWRDLPDALGRMRKADQIVFNLPMVAWKRSILLSWVLLLFAFGHRQQVIVFLHEWSSLHPLRRFVLMPFVFFSKKIILLSPYIRDQLAADPWVGWAKRKSALALHAPTVRRPTGRVVSEAVRKVEKLRANNTVLIGHFGSVYKGKGTDALLDICAHLRGRGVDAAVVYIGGMIKSLDGYENDFRNKVAVLKLNDHVVVTGYVDSNEELFAIFDLVQVFMYSFPEGLTARRSSVLASLQSRRPVVVSEPIVKGEFSHHNGYTALIESGALILFPSSVTIEGLADYILSGAEQPDRQALLVDYDRWWKAAAQKVERILGSQLSPRRQGEFNDLSDIKA